MKNKTYRFAAVAAVLLALALVFVSPVVATTDGEGEDTNPVYVAFIGEQGYEKLQYAIKNATENDTIYLVGTISEGSFKLPATIRNITIDGQGTAVVKDTVINAIDGNSVDYQGLTIKNTTFENSRFVLGGLRTGSVIYKDLVFEGNTFKDIVDSNSMAAIHMNIASEENEYIENFRFVGNTIINVTGSSNSGVLMKNAKGDVIFEGNTISNVVNNAIQCINAKADINLVIKNNRLSSNLGSVLNLYNVPAVTLEDNTFTLNEGQKELGNFNVVAQIGNIYYSNLQDVIDATEAGGTITLLDDVTTTSMITIDKSITIDGNGYTIIRKSGTGSTGLFLMNDTESSTITATIQNLSVVADSYPIYVASKTNLIIKDSTLNGNLSTIYISTWYTQSIPEDSTIDDSTIDISNSVLIATNFEAAGGDFDSGVIIFEGENITATIVDSTLKAIAKSTANQSIITFSEWGIVNNNIVTITGSELVHDKGSTNSVFVFDDVENVDNLVTVGAGVTANFNPSAYLASNCHIKTVDGGFEVTNMRLITFPNDGLVPIPVENNTVANLPNPTKTNYNFVGWYTDAGFNTAYDTTAKVISDLELYAKWEKKPSSSSSSSSSSSNTQNDSVEEPETPVEEPVAGEATVETEVTDGGEVALETPSTGGSAAVADEEEAKVTGVVLPTGTEGKVTFIPISEQAAPAGKETQTKKVFEINIPNYEKGKAAVIKFQMTVAELEADGKTAAEVALWHFDEETGEWTKLVTSYVIENGIVYFEAITNDFSPFAIVYEDTPVDEPVDEPETPASPAPLAAVIAALGAAVVLRRK